MDYWHQKVIAISGGSAGLGLSIARAFLARGAKIALIARNRERLEQAKQSLASEAVFTVSADVTCPEQSQRAVTELLSEFGQLDGLVNNVGRSTRIDFRKATIQDYRDLMDVNFISAVNCTTAALDALTQTSGHIVNIGSLSCKTAWPFMAPYTTSKFALAAYSHHLRLEGPSNVHTMLVCPGPIKRDDAGLRYQEQAKDLPEQARKPGAGVKAKGVDPEVLAKKIIRGCEKRKRELLPLQARLIFAALAISPRFGDWLLKLKMKR